MSLWNLIMSGGKGYTTQEGSDGAVTVRRNDGFLHSTGTKIGNAQSKKDALDIVKSDSGADDTDIRKL